MPTRVHLHRPRRPARLFATAVAGAVSLGGLLGQQFQIETFQLAPEGAVVRHPAATDRYYRLLRGARITDVTRPVDVRLGEGRDPGTGLGTLRDATPPVEGAFYRVQAVPLTQPLDSDGDGIDDVFELRHATFLNPVNPADAGSDADNDFISNLDEYRAGSNLEIPALTTVQQTSPANGEGGVAVTRETIIRLSQPLAPAAVVTKENLFATFADRQLLSRCELGPDRRTLTLFYLEQLPANARVRVTFKSTGLLDHLGRAPDLDGDDRPGGTRLIDFDTLNNVGVPKTAVIGTVFASEPIAGPGGFQDHPLQDVIIEVVGAEQELRTKTDAQGHFRLEPAPPGRFFVHVDGRTAVGSDWPGGAYYPVVGKAWEGVAGQTVAANGTGEIYLPLIQADALRATSANEETKITFPKAVLDANPELAGVEVRVPANALFADNGTRGGKVGIAPVAPDRLPEPLPPGLQFPLVITIQTDGPQNFDRPAPVRFPNLPDPITGLKLPPGAKTALWSFNHDTGRWEVQGAMTITADGNFAETDPGVGVRQPGWHGAAPGGRGRAGAPCAPTDSVIALAAITGGPTALPPRADAPPPPPAPLAAASPPETPPHDCADQEGRHYWALECLYPSANAPVQRGVGDSSGVVNNNLILAPNSYYRLWVVQDRTGLIGFADFTTPNSGFDLALPHIVLHRTPDGDRDSDGIPDLVEFVLGSNPDKADSDGDGMNDNAEFIQGLTLTDGLAVTTGILATVVTPGQAKDVGIGSGRVVLALGTEGIAIFDLVDGLAPKLTGRLKLPGDAQSVACAGNLVGVALGGAGLAIVDVADPPAARVIHQLNLGSPALVAEVGGPYAFVAGLANGQVVSVDAISGGQLSRVTVAAGLAVLDLEPFRDRMLVLFSDRAVSLPIESGGNGGVTLGKPVSANVVLLTGGVNDAVGRNRLATDGRFAFATHRQGYHVIDLAIPDGPVLARTVSFPMFGWKQIVPNGTGLGIAATSPNQAFDGPHNISVYDLQTDTFLAEFPTPGIARAVALDGGRAYVADQGGQPDGSSALQVINYLAFDSKGQPPTLSIESNIGANGVEEGSLVRLRALVGDDVQVARVEFFANGTLLGGVGRPPWEFAFLAPLRNGAGALGASGVRPAGPRPHADPPPRLRLEARAFDTGGNETLVAYEWDLTPDQTGPRVIGTIPSRGSMLGSPPALFVQFSEPVDATTIGLESLKLVRLGTPPNEPAETLVESVYVTYRDVNHSAALTPTELLAMGQYRLTIQGVKDLVGNPMTAPVPVAFRIIGGLDTDYDGLPDSVETQLGLDPLNGDTNLNGILDGAEDFDGDGLSNTFEIAAGTDPTRKDSDFNGVPDGDEDPDFDSISNRDEAAAGTDPTLYDTEGDGWNDSEGQFGGDPLDPRVYPLGIQVSAPAVEVVSPEVPKTAENEIIGVITGVPAVDVISPGLSRDENGFAPGVTSGQPTVVVGPPSQGVDLAVTVSASSVQVFEGQSVALTAVVRNFGSVAATGVHLTGHLPPGTAAQSLTATAGACQVQNGVVVCDVALFPPGGFKVEVQLNTAGMLADQTDDNGLYWNSEWTVSGNESDADSSNNTGFQGTHFVQYLDYGDAPEPTYPTWRWNDGARHRVTPAGPRFTRYPFPSLGTAVDDEWNGNPSEHAEGDDLAGSVGDDEDGIEFLTPLVPGQPAQVRISYTGTAARIDAWIDFDGNGWNRPEEHIITSPLGGLPPSPLTRTFDVPSWAIPGQTFARFRISSAGSPNPTGYAADGEVEDYWVEIQGCNCPTGDLPVSSAELIYSWMTDTATTIATIREEHGTILKTTWGDPKSSKTFADIQTVAVDSDYVYVQASGLASYVMGPWFFDYADTVPFVNLPRAQGTPNLTFKFPRFPVEDPTTHDNTPPIYPGDTAEIGLWVNGVAIFNASDLFSWNPNMENHAYRPPIVGVDDQVYGSNVWHRCAWYSEAVTFDYALLHAQGDGQYHAHNSPAALRLQLNDNVAPVTDPATGEITAIIEDISKLHHSPILGWALDGHPIYGPYGYAEPYNAKSGVRRMVSGYVQRNGDYGTANLASTGRTSLPIWSLRTTGRTTTTLASSDEFGPDFDRDPAKDQSQYEEFAFGLGRYLEDYEYLGDLPVGIAKPKWDLDQFNGRCCVTPEFPDGTYAYFVTISDTGEPAFPFVLGPQYCARMKGARMSGGVPNNATIVFQNLPKPETPGPALTTERILTWNPASGGYHEIPAPGRKPAPPTSQAAPSSR